MLTFNIITESLSQKYLDFAEKRLGLIGNSFKNYLKQDLMKKQGIVDNITDILKNEDDVASLLKKQFDRDQLSAVSSVLKSGINTAGKHVGDLAGATATVGVPLYAANKLDNFIRDKIDSE